MKNIEIVVCTPNTMNKSNNNTRNIQKSQTSQSQSQQIGLVKLDCIEEQQVAFFDGNQGFQTIVMSEPDQTFNSAKTPSLGMSEWLARPVQIAEQTWTPGSTFSSVFRPWQLFINHASVKNKLEHYAYFRGKLNVKFVINGSPSLYGTLIAAYDPLTHLTGPFSGTQSGAFVQSSQLPHVFLRTQQNQGGCLCLPFFYYKDWLLLEDDQAFSDMGAIGVRSTPGGELRSTGGVTTDVVTVTTFAWVTELELSHTTNAVILQGDEYASTPISSTASAVSSIARRLTDVPLIGAYAKATELAASAIASIAAMFGFSRPMVLTNPQFVKNNPFGLMANTSTHETVEKLAIDPKQELCIDPRTVGLSNVDELSILGIAQRETWFGEFIWTTTDIPGAKKLAMIVDPMMFHLFSTFKYPTASRFASLPFTYWRGSISFRFLVTCSQFHRGRLLIQWDPRGLQDVADTNTVVSQIVDLTVTRDFELTIPYGQDTSFLKINKDRTNPNYSEDPTGTPLVYVPENSNGILMISVLNSLSSLPGADADVNVLAFMKVGDDFEVSVPAQLSTSEYYTVEGAVVQSDMVDDEVEESEGTPVSEELNEVIAVEKPVDTSLVYSGEKYVSFRSLLKRYALSRTLVFDANDSPAPGRFNIITSNMSRWPLPPGHMDAGFDSFLGGELGNNTKQTLFTYLQGAFVGMRGSSRWKFNNLSRTDSTQLCCARTGKERNSATYRVSTEPFVTNETLANSLTPQIGWAGYSLTNGKTQTGVEIDSPHYSRYRFISASPYAMNVGSDTEGSKTQTLEYSAITGIQDTTPYTPVVTLHHSVGDDFNFFFYRFAPIIQEYVLLSA